MGAISVLNELLLRDFSCLQEDLEHHPGLSQYVVSAQLFLEHKATSVGTFFLQGVLLFVISPLGFILGDLGQVDKELIPLNADQITWATSEYLL